MSSKNDYLVKKAKQEARRAARDRVDQLTPEYCATLIVRRRPRYFPRFVWIRLLKLVLKF
jgi:hypothetical protein